MFKWLKAQGGLEAMKKRNEEKAQLLYDFLDQSKLFKGTARKEDRSIMNVPFVTGDADLDAKFVAEAKMPESRASKAIAALAVCVPAFITPCLAKA